MKFNAYYVYRAIFGLMIFLIIVAFVTGLYVFVTESYGSFWEYSSFEISDWLINYEGGFVRRGLMGSLLFGLYQIHPYPVRYAILILYVLGFLTICGFLVSIFKKEGMSVFILPFSICLYYSFACDLIWTRRDYWALMIALGIYYSYFKLFTTSSFKWYLLFVFLSVFTLLMHEASFFFTFPMLLIHSVRQMFSTQSHERWRCMRFFFLWLPVFLVLILIIVNKGNAQLMYAIWDSWESCFKAYPMKSGIIPQIGIGVNFLSITSLDAIQLHVRLVWLGLFAPYVPSLPFTVSIIVGVYYFVTRLNTVDLKFYSLKAIDNVLLSNIMLIQFVCLFPMFGFLSCDLGRVIPYWVITSLFLYYVLKQKQPDFFFPKLLNNLSVWLQEKIGSVQALNNPWVYCCLLFFLPLNSYYGATYEGIIPVHFFIKALKVFGALVSR